MKPVSPKEWSTIVKCKKNHVVLNTFKECPFCNRVREMGEAIEMLEEALKPFKCPIPFIKHGHCSEASVEQVFTKLAKMKKKWGGA